MMAEVIVHLRANVNLPERLLGRDVAPVHPDTADAALRSIVYLNVQDDEHPDEVVRQLLGLPEVDAAYVKPPASTP